MRSKQALKNMLSNIILQVLVAVSGIIIPRFFIKVYGSDINGMVSSITQFITYIGIVEAGIGTASTVALYGPLAKDDKEGINHILSAVKKFYRKSGWLFVALTVILIGVYPIFVRDQVSSSLVRWMIIILASSNAIDFFFLGKYRVLLTADQKNYIITGAQSIGTVLNMVVTIILIQNNVNVLIVKLVATLVYILRFVIVYIYVKKRYKYIDFSVESDDDALEQRWDALTHQIVGLIVCNTDIVLLTICMGKGSLLEISVYTVYNLVIASGTALMSSFSNGLASGFGEVISKNETDTLKRSFKNYEYLYYMVLFWCFTTLGTVFGAFIKIYTADIHDVQYFRVSLLVLFTATFFLQNVRIPGLTIICAAGHFRQTKIRAILEAVINIGVSLALVWQFGIVGVLIGTCCSYAYRSTDIILYNNKYLVKGSLKTTILRLLRNGFTSALIFAIGFAFLQMNDDSWIMFFINTIIVAAVSGLILVIVNFIFEPKEFKVLFQRFGNILGR